MSRDSEQRGLLAALAFIESVSVTLLYVYIGIGQGQGTDTQNLEHYWKKEVDNYTFLTSLFDLMCVTYGRMLLVLLLVVRRRLVHFLVLFQSISSILFVITKYVAANVKEDGFEKKEVTLLIVSLLYAFTQAFVTAVGTTKRFTYAQKKHEPLLDKIAIHNDPTIPSERMATAGDRFIEVLGVGVRFKSSGDGAPLSVLLHGLCSSADAFDEILAKNEKGTMVSFDRVGWGLTERPQNKDAYSLQFQVKLLAKFIERLGFKTAVLVGHGEGALIAMHAYLQHQSLVHSLVLVSPSLEPCGELPWSTRKMLLRFRSLAPRLLKSFVEKSLLMAPLSRKMEAKHRRLFRINDWATALENYARAIATNDSIQEHLDANMLNNVPTLLIFGDTDPQAGEFVRMGDALNVAKLKMIAHCAHFPHMEAPSTFSLELATFLNEVCE